MYGTLVTTFRIEHGTRLPLGMVTKNLGLGFGMLIVAQGCAWRRYGWFDLGTDYLDLWLYFSFATIMAIGWQVGYLLPANRRFRSIGRIVGVVVAAGVALIVLNVYLRAPHVLETGWFLELSGAISFCLLLLNGTFQLDENDTASRSATGLLGLKGLFMALFVLYAWRLPPIRTGYYPFLAALPVGTIALSLLASASIVWVRSAGATHT
jgi:hypothetical protein